MNREWSRLNKEMQAQIRNKKTWPAGIHTLFALRNQLMDTLISFRKELPQEVFHAMPFMGAEGYHGKTIAYSIWHVFRIEDMVANTLIKDEDQVFFTGNYQQRMHAPLITTGNELVKEEIAEFSRQLDLDALYAYAMDVKKTTENMIPMIPYEKLKSKPAEKQRQKLQALHVVSENEKAIWLVDYWCGKDLRGLIQMPLSRHWIMHIEACLRIKNKLYPPA